MKNLIIKLLAKLGVSYSVEPVTDLSDLLDESTVPNNRKFLPIINETYEFNSRTAGFRYNEFSLNKINKRNKEQ